jgi:hypothetical protein
MPDPGAGSGTGRGPSAKKAGSRQRPTSVSATPASSEPAPIRKIPPIPAKLE